MSSTQCPDPKSHQTLAYFFRSLHLHDSPNIYEFIKRIRTGGRLKVVEMPQKIILLSVLHEEVCSVVFHVCWGVVCGVVLQEEPAAKENTAGGEESKGSLEMWSDLKKHGATACSRMYFWYSNKQSQHAQVLCFVLIVNICNESKIPETSSVLWK